MSIIQWWVKIQELKRCYVCEWKTVDDLNTLDKSYIFTLNVSATQRRHKIIIEPKNEINDHKTLLARLEATSNYSLFVLKT